MRTSDGHVRFGPHAVALPYRLTDRLAQWGALRKEMVRGVPPAFTRDEWAYLLAFLDPQHLREVFSDSFGNEGEMQLRSLWRPRGPIAIWLPNNVSLLGPLVVILASFSAQPIRVKVGTRSDELCTAFARYALEHLPEGELRTYLGGCLDVRAFDRHDPLNPEMAASAAVRIAFGSDEGVAAVHALPHPVDSIGISFGNRRSEAWVEQSSLDDGAVDTLLKVFAIYGQAGCTSPRRVVLIEGSSSDAERLRERLIQRWSLAIKRKPAMHTASLNIMNCQLNRACGWDAELAPDHGAVFGVGPVGHGEMKGLMSLGITWATAEEAARGLPPNIQTIGFIAQDPGNLLARVATTQAKRFVPVGQMHHFGPVWDGSNFFTQMFEQLAVGR